MSNEFSFLTYPIPNTDPLEDSDFWEGLNVNYKYITQGEISEKCQKMLIRKNLQVINELAGLFSIPLDESDNKLKIIEKLSSMVSTDKKMLLLLDSFSTRKRAAIKLHYNLLDSGKSETLLAQLVEIFSANSNSISDIYTENNWFTRKSGNVFKYNTSKITFDSIKDLTTITHKRKHLIDYLYNKTNQTKHKIYCCSFNKKSQEITIEFHKQKNYYTVPDFDKNLNNKEPEPFLLKFSFLENSYEVKSNEIKYSTILRTYFDNEFNAECSEINGEVFEKASYTDILNALITTNSDQQFLSDCIINGLSLSNSRLTYSPTLNLFHKKESVLPSYNQLIENNIVQFSSLNDINYFNVIFRQKNKKVKVSVVENGDFYLSYDDSHMDLTDKEDFESTFLKIINIPLKRKISSLLFKEGKGSKIDYVMRILNSPNFTSSENDILNSLLNTNKLTKTSHEYYECNSCENIVYKNNIIGESFNCPCGADDYALKKDSTIELNLDEIKKSTKKMLSELYDSANYEIIGNTRLTHNKNIIEFLAIKDLSKPGLIQFLVADTAISSHLIKRIIKTLTPTILICIGMTQNEIDNLNDKGILAIGYGYLLEAQRNNLVEKLLEKIEQLQISHQTSISRAADLARTDIESKICKEKVDNDYTDKIFEDDVYSIFKDIFVNSIKWGKEKSGKPVPEGLVSLSYNYLRNKKDVVYSYDCKLTQSEKGYDLGRSEQRKAAEYVNTLNGDPYLQSFSSDNHVSVHIFISNNFKESQLKNIEEYFDKHVVEKCIPVFFDIDALSKLHKYYRSNKESLVPNRDKFNYYFDSLLSNKRITAKKIDEFIDNVKDTDLETVKQLNPRKFDR